MGRAWRAVTWWAYLAALAAVAVPIVAGHNRPGYDHQAQFISELGERGADHGVLVSLAGFLPIGILVALFMLFALWDLRGSGVLLRLGVVVVGLSTAFGYIASAFARCAAGCPAHGDAQQTMHNVAGYIEYGGVPVGLLLIGWGARRLRGWGYVAWWAFTSTALFVVLAPHLEEHRWAGERGTFQRILELAIFGTIVLIGHQLREKHAGPWQPAEARSTAWWKLGTAKDAADVLLKLAATLGILAAGLITLLPAKVQVVPGQGTSGGYFEAMVDPVVFEAAAREASVVVPDAVWELVRSYDAANEKDLEARKNSTSTRARFKEICPLYSGDVDGAFGAGFCAHRSGKDSTPLYRYRGRTYERLLVEANNVGIDGAPAPHLDAPHLAQMLQLLHRAEYNVGVVEVRNTGQAEAKVLIIPPNGYSRPGVDLGELSMRPGASVIRRYETERGGVPITSGRQFGVQWSSGSGVIPGGTAVVLLAMALVAALWVGTLVMDARSSE